jgi:hypothetical protein
MLDLSDFSAAVPDPRAAMHVTTCPGILLIAFAATLCGAESCVDIAAFARRHSAA